MPEYAPLTLPDDGRLAENIAHFGRALRKAGLRSLILRGDDGWCFDPAVPVRVLSG